MNRELTRAQERRLLSKHLTGDSGAGRWETIRVLIERGYLLDCNGVYVSITQKGIDYCDKFHHVM